MKTKLLAFMLLFFASFSLMAQITGTVTNSSTQAAIANHTVYLVGDSMSSIYMTTTTNSNGQYSFTNIGTSSYYDVFTYDCNQSLVTQTVYTANTTVNFSICVSGGGTSCQAAFTSTPDSTNANIIYFNDNSTGNPTSWSWNFGDGNSSTSQNPSHTYSSAGSYTVTLSISSSTCSDTISNTVVIGGQTGCQAAFTSVPDSSNTSLIHFINQSTGNPTTYSWNFGDGNSSSLQNPSHTYATAGNYTVSLSISGNNCQSTINHSITVAGGGSSYSVSGTINAGSNNLDVGVVILLDSATANIYAQTPVDSLGGYSFSNVLNGSYLVYAVPATNSVYQNFAPTYYQNNISWTSATTLNVNSSLTGINISLVQMTPNSGSGSISGNLGTGNKGGIAGAVVNLLTTSNAPVATTITDVNGDYTFSGIGNNTYKIWVEIAGKTTTPIVVTINNGNLNSTNNDFVVKNNTVVPKTVSIDNSQKELQMKTYPNPVENQLNIALSLESNTQISVEIYNLAGQNLLSNNYNLQAGSQTLRINLSDLAKGSYILRITNTNGAHTKQLITKIR
jgi:PKD repeat protein